MITPRDISQFFTIIEVLSNPEKAKRELETLANLRNSVDADLVKADEMMVDAKNMKNAAQDVLSKQEKVKAEQDRVFEAQEEKAKVLARGEEKAKLVVDQQTQISHLLDAREVELTDRERVFIERASKQDQREASIQVREEALRKKEADYVARMNKLRQIAE